VRRFTSTTLFVCALLLGIAAMAQETHGRNSAGSSAGAPVQTQAEMADRGRSLYAHYCSHCHGFNMVNPGTVTFDLRQFPRNEKARFLNSVTHGKNGGMPPWGGVLSAEEMDQLWAYVLTGGKR
jgi:cytochrome c55X